MTSLGTRGEPGIDSCQQAFVQVMSETARICRCRRRVSANHFVLLGRLFRILYAYLPSLVASYIIAADDPQVRPQRNKCIVKVLAIQLEIWIHGTSLVPPRTPFIKSSFQPRNFAASAVP